MKHCLLFALVVVIVYLLHVLHLLVAVAVVLLLLLLLLWLLLSILIAVGSISAFLFRAFFISASASRHFLSFFTRSHPPSAQNPRPQGKSLSASVEHSQAPLHGAYTYFPFILFCNVHYMPRTLSPLSPFLSL